MDSDNKKMEDLEKELEEKLQLKLDKKLDSILEEYSLKLNEECEENINLKNDEVKNNETIENQNNHDHIAKVEPKIYKNYMHRNNNNYLRDYIIFDNVRKEYKTDDLVTVALDDASFTIDEGELVVFLGQSGAGKSTALNMVGGIDNVTSGRIIVGDKEITNYNLNQLTEYRRKNIGFIFQSYNLISNLTAKENIELSTEISNEKIDSILALERVGLKGKEDKTPAQLSGGEQQRVAIARALAKKPKLLLCDEPTGALDYETGKQVLKLLQITCRNQNITTIIITHNSAITPMADKIVHFNSGKVVEVEKNENPVDIEELEW